MERIDVELKAVSFLQVAPYNQFLWRDTLIGHCTDRWKTLSECREIFRWNVGDKFEKIHGSMIFDSEEDSDGYMWNTLRGEFLIEFNDSFVDDWLSLISVVDLSGDLDSVFYPVDKSVGNGITRWRIKEYEAFQNGSVKITSKNKMARKDGDIMIYKMEE